jgi:hypothetical protein
LVQQPLVAGTTCTLIHIHAPKSRELFAGGGMSNDKAPAPASGSDADRPSESRTSSPGSQAGPPTTSPHALESSSSACRPASPVGLNHHRPDETDTGSPTLCLWRTTALSLQNCGIILGIVVAFYTVYYTVRGYNLAQWTALKDEYEWCGNEVVR